LLILGGGGEEGAWGFGEGKGGGSESESGRLGVGFWGMQQTSNSIISFQENNQGSDMLLTRKTWPTPSRNSAHVLTWTFIKEVIDCQSDHAQEEQSDDASDCTSCDSCSNITMRLDSGRDSGYSAWKR